MLDIGVLLLGYLYVRKFRLAIVVSEERKKRREKREKRKAAHLAYRTWVWCQSNDGFGCWIGE